MVMEKISAAQEAAVTLMAGGSPGKGRATLSQLRSQEQGAAISRAR